LGTKVLEAKQIQIENKKKAKGMTSDYGTPSSIRASKLKIELIECVSCMFLRSSSKVFITTKRITNHEVFVLVCSTS
jgi:hypothetical protein